VLERPIHAFSGTLRGSYGSDGTCLVRATTAALYLGHWLEDDLIDNGFASQMQFWWLALKPYILNMRKQFGNDSYYDRFEAAAKLFEANAPSKEKPAKEPKAAVEMFLQTEAM
jgi:hypothetical protein